MHSIIDEITGAEAQAAQIRQDAVLAARETVSAAREGAEKQIASQAEFARTKLREESQKAEAEGDAAAKEILKARADESRDAVAGAETKLREAVDYLVGRVVS